MSEPTKDAKEAKPATPPAGAPAAEPAKAAPPVVLIAVVALALGAGAALGGLFVAPQLVHARQVAAASQLADPHGKKAKKEKKEQPKLFE